MRIEASQRILAAFEKVTPGQGRKVFTSLTKELYAELEDAPFWGSLPSKPTQLPPTMLPKIKKYFFENDNRSGINLVENVYAFGVIAGIYRMPSKF